jgi:hypothetical protein
MQHEGNKLAIYVTCCNTQLTDVVSLPLFWYGSTEGGAGRTTDGAEQRTKTLDDPFDPFVCPLPVLVEGTAKMTPKKKKKTTHDSD